MPRHYMIAVHINYKHLNEKHNIKGHFLNETQKTIPVEMIDLLQYSQHRLYLF